MSSTGLEQVIAPERDMSRAHWQRTVGNVALTDLTEQFYNRIQFGEFDPDNMDRIHGLARGHLRHDTTLIPFAWASALMSTHVMEPLERMQIMEHGFFETNCVLDEGLSTYAYYRKAHSVFEEGMRTQVTLPLNLARDVSYVAGREGSDNFAVNSLSDIASMFRRPDFHALVDAAAFTRNGIWGRYATEPFAHFGGNTKEHYPELDFNFDSLGSVSFSTQFTHFLRREMAAVNKVGISKQEPSAISLLVGEMTTSGCPVRHLRPHFTDSAEDIATAKSLSRVMDKPRAEILAERRTSVIAKGLLRMAMLLEAAAPHLEKDNDALREWQETMSLIR